MLEIAGIPITETVFYSWIIMAIIIISAVIFRIAVKRAYLQNNQIPVGAANVAEIIVGGINDFSKDNIHHHWKPFAPYIATIGIFLALANTMVCMGSG
jgi:F-type H+-transporting ATPase subunit a